MIPIRPWLHWLMIPFVFLLGLLLSIGPVWRYQEKPFIRAVTQDDTATFPVLVRAQNGQHRISTLADSTNRVVTSQLDEGEINRDLNASIGSAGAQRFFCILEQAPDSIHVSLEIPTLHDSKLQVWYEIRAGRIRPQRILRYGPGFVFLVVEWTVAGGLITALGFCILFRRKRAAPNAKTRGLDPKGR